MVRDRRQRYQPARKRSSRRSEAGGPGRKLLVKLVVAIGLGVLVGGLGFSFYTILAQSSFFQIVDIEIDCGQRLSKAEILDLSGVDVQSNLVKINSGQVQGLLENHRWIERAVVSRNWPDRLLISITERRPVAMVNLADGLHYVDRVANVFAPVEQGGDLDYPVITCLAGDTSGMDEALLLIKYGGRPNPNLPVQNISEIRVSEDDLILFLVDRPFPIRLGRGDVWEKYRRVVKVLAVLYRRKEFTRVAYVDIDYAAGKVLVGMGAG